jgi:hypothetical protein
MQAWIAEHRSRIGVGKYTPRTRKPAPIALPVREVVADAAPVERVLLAESSQGEHDEDDKGTLQRLEKAERVAYQRYIDSGGSERLAQVWLLVCDQKRKLISDQARLASDVSEAETRFIGTCAEVVLTLKHHLETMPRLLGVLCEGLAREHIEAKACDQIRRTLQQAATDLTSQLKGTSLEVWLKAD